MAAGKDHFETYTGADASLECAHPGKPSYPDATTQTTAPAAGTGSSVPATVEGWYKVKIAGVDRWVPFF